MNSKDMRQSELAEALSQAARLVMVSCINCQHFKIHNDEDICRLNGLRVPARIIVAGCPQFKHNDG